MEQSILWVDFETRSRCDLARRGSDNYALDGSTQVICMCYAFDDESVETWTPDMPFPERVRGHKGRIATHNAAFERLIFRYVLGLDFKDEQFYCTAAQARANCLPGALGALGRFAGTMQKDFRGADLIRKLCIPQFDGEFLEDADLLKEMVEYCVRDVETMREVSKAMRQLTDEELHDYHVNERINDHGIRIDVDLCRAAMKYAADEKHAALEELVELTNGVVTSADSPKLRQWVLERIGPEALRLMKVKKKDKQSGEFRTKLSIGKSVREGLLNLADENPDEVPLDVADVIRCADSIKSASIAKFKAMLDRADDEDQRARGAFVFCGAVDSGRFASYGVQLHNYPRKCFDVETAEEVRTAMLKGEPLTPRFGNRVTDVLKKMLRPALAPSKGNVFVIADWSSIEGRIGPWIADCVEGEEKLEQFRKGIDPYIVNAAQYYGMTYEEIYREYHEEGVGERRQNGKTMELAFGFLGAVGSYRAFGGKGTDDEIKVIVQTWRDNNQWAQIHGRRLEKLYMAAMRHPGKEFKEAKAAYFFDGTHLWYQLPSGKVLNFPFARLDEEGVSYAKAAWKPSREDKEWPRARLWQGAAVNRYVQGTAADILRHGLRELDDLYYGIAGHVHDEIILEVPEAQAEQAVQDMRRYMTKELPMWAAGLPLEAEIKIAKRYGK